MKIICIGRNYAAHIEELKNEKPGQPVVFLKPDTALIKGGTPFFYPDFSTNIHHEIELVLKISKEGKYIQPQFAHRYFEEIGLGIDFTARDLQDQCKAKGLPWEIAKAFNGSAPIGEFKSVAELLFDFATIISYVSQFFTLKKGDLIYTGTPAGVGPVQIGDQLIGFIGNEKMLHVEVK